MSERLGRVALGGEREQVFLGEEIAQRREYSERTAREVDEEIRAILDEAYERALRTPEEYREGLDLLADKLLDKEEVMGYKVLALLGVERKTPQDSSN